MCGVNTLSRVFYYSRNSTFHPINKRGSNTFISALEMKMETFISQRNKCKSYYPAIDMMLNIQ